jgi:hypothetical protein
MGSPRRMRLKPPPQVCLDRPVHGGFAASGQGGVALVPPDAAFSVPGSGAFPATRRSRMVAGVSAGAGPVAISLRREP